MKYLTCHAKFSVDNFQTAIAVIHLIKSGQKVFNMQHLEHLIHVYRSRETFIAAS